MFKEKCFSNWPWWPSGLTYNIKAVKCCMVCVRSQVRIPLGITISIAQSQKWLVTNSNSSVGITSPLQWSQHGKEFRRKADKKML